MSNQPATAAPASHPAPQQKTEAPENRSLNTSVTEDDRTEGGPTDESGHEKLDTTNDT